MPLSAIDGTIRQKISKGVGPWRFLLGACFNYELDFFDSYRAVQTIYFIVSELWWFVFSGKWSVSSKLSKVHV